MTDREVLEMINKIADADYATLDEVPVRVLLQIKVALLSLLGRVGISESV